MLAGVNGAFNIDAQVDRLNAAFGGVIKFEKLTVLKYEVADATSMLGACFDNGLAPPTGCSDPDTINYISSETWTAPAWSGGTGVPGDPSDISIRSLLPLLAHPGPKSPPLSPSILNVYMWDW
jgi:hypothetical protein